MTLQTFRKLLINVNFAVKLLKGPRSDQLFTLTEQGVTRNEKKIVKKTPVKQQGVVMRRIIT